MPVSSMIKAILVSNANIVNVFGTRIFPDIIPNNKALPAISYTVNNITKEGSKDRETEIINIDATISVFAKTRTDCETYGGYVETIFNRIKGSYGSETVITTIHEGESWDYVEDQTKPGTTNIGFGVFVHTLNFLIKTK